jgi:tripartite ATP-independent transporter DctM subunit
LLAQYAWNILTTQELLALPMFILMGEILFQSRLSRSLFQGLAPWAGLLPGRLLHVNVVGCSIFAAISGSSAATTQVVGRMALAELLKRGYSKDIAIGSLAGAGTLGFLIPPSNIMIIYGVLGDVSVLKLFTAGFIPGFLLAGCFMAWVMIHTTLRPGLVPETERDLRNLSMLDRIRALKELAPAMFLIASVLGSMYGGLATPSESAAVGVLGALIVAALQGGLTLKALRDIAMGSVLTCSMIAMILLGASILGSAAAFLGIPRAIADFVAGMGLSPFMLIVALIIFYLILGCFLDGFSMIVLTLPIVLPIVKQAGFDPVWFGIFLVLVVEMAQITPPVGFNLFVIQGLTDDGLGYIAKVTLPYLIIMILFTLALTVFPQVVLFLPRVLAGG